MINFIVNISLMNLLGGRWEDVVPGTGDGRLLFRCILPAFSAAFYALGLTGNAAFSAYAGFAVLAGSALWFPFGWGFDEIHGGYSADKYPAWIRRIGLYFFPLKNSPANNKARGVLMKGLRGLFDILTFGLLAIVHPMAFALWSLTGLMGVIYWLCGRIFPETRAVAMAEIVYGLLRGLLIALALTI